MKITKQQIRQIIKEEQQKLLKEYSSINREAQNPLLGFAQAYAGLGDSVQEQLIDVVNAMLSGNLDDAIADINPNAIKLAHQRLRSSLLTLVQDSNSDDAQEILDSMEEALHLDMY